MPPAIPIAAAHPVRCSSGRAGSINPFAPASASAYQFQNLLSGHPDANARLFRGIRGAHNLCREHIVKRSHSSYDGANFTSFVECLDVHVAAGENALATAHE